MNQRSLLEEELAQYLRVTEGAGRIMEGIREKYRSFGRLSGILSLELTASEADFVNGLLKKHYQEGDKAGLPVKRISDAFGQTRFAEADFTKACEIYFGEPLIAKKEARNNAVNRRRIYFESLVAECPSEKVREWLTVSEDLDSASGLEYIRGLYRKDPVILKTYISHLSEIQRILEGGLKTSLPILAAEATKDPHALDKDRELYRLLVLFLAWDQAVSTPANQFALQQLLYRGGIETDIGTRTVMTYGLVGIGGEGSRGWETFRENLEPLTLSLKNLDGIKEIRPYRQGAPVIGVENPAVFMYLIQREKNLSLICTSGQLNLLDHRLIQILLQNPEQGLIYSGDFDPEGLLIADKIWSGYPNQVQLIGYEKELYQQALAEKTISSKRLRQLEKLQNPQLQEFAKEIQHTKKPGYQEYILYQLYKRFCKLV